MQGKVAVVQPCQSLYPFRVLNRFPRLHAFLPICHLT